MTTTRLQRAWQLGLAATVGLIGGITIDRYGFPHHYTTNTYAATPFTSPPASYPGGDISGAATGGSGPPFTPHSRTREIALHGFPSFDSLKSYNNFVLSYDKRNKQANWVMEHLTPASIAYNEEVSRKDVEFFEDSSLHPYFRSNNSDYFRSGFDRGHLAAAGNHRTHQKLMDETFVLSNISPQVGKGFNRDAWNKLEKYTRYRTKQSVNTYVCTGPLYLPRRDPLDGKMYVKYQVIGKNNVSVPTHFFKILLIETEPGTYHLESYVMPNEVIDDRTPLDAFRVPLDSIERSSGLLFFSQLPKAKMKTINGQPNT